MDSTSYASTFILFRNAILPLSTTFSYGFLIFVIGILPQWLTFFYTYESLQDQLSAFWDVEDKFDYIIVGAGSAGAVLANRLSEDSKVLLLEAGGLPHPLQSVPLLAFFLYTTPKANWGYHTVPQKRACLAMNSEECYWPRGRSLGGSSTLNFMIYLRGHKYDYERWVNVTGDPRWNYENVLRLFKKSENYQGEWDNDRYHSHGGYLEVTEPTYKGMSEVYCKAAEEMGLPRTDLNADFIEGCAPMYNTQQHRRDNPKDFGKRHDTYNAFLKPVRHRTNLHIRKFSHVSRILFQGPENRAVGVKYIRHGQNKVAFAAKEVILSAGAVNSPQILMLSGIGPKNHLRSLKIPVLVDLPVGKNLQDHMTSIIGPFIVDKQISINLDTDLNVGALDDFFNHGDGVLSSTTCQANTFMVSEVAKSLGQHDWPDIQHMIIGMNVFKLSERVYTETFNIKPGIMGQFFKGAHGKDSFQIMSTAVHPFSRGEIRLRSRDPLVSPLIDPNYFENELDLKVLVEGAKRGVDLVENAPTFKAINARLHSTPFPGCENVTFRSDAYWECYHRHYSLTVYHPSGTCAMGKPSSPTAVVDSELRVIGTKTLRVVDASIMPYVTTANTNAPTIMIAEMGAEMIQKTWRTPENEYK